MSNQVQEVQALIDASMPPRIRYFIVVAVDAVNKKVQVKRTASSPVTRWIPYNPDLTLNVNDRVRVEGEDLNTAVISHKV